jgi:ADP-heptose:LPS heptosyltransferase
LQPDAIADLHSVLRTRILRLYLSFSGIPFRRLDKARAEKRALTRPSGKRWKPLMPTWRRYAAVFENLGMPLKPEPTDVLPKAAVPKVFEALLKTGTKIGLAPFAAHAGKCYPEASMQEVIRLLQAHDGVHIYLFGGGKQEVETLKGWEQEYSNCISVAGYANLDAELDLISNLDLMVSMDSGNGHLAAMFGVPVLTLWGVTHPYAGFAPYGQTVEGSLTADRTEFPEIPTSIYGNKVPAGYEKAMESIAPEAVCARILQMAGLSGPV